MDAPFLFAYGTWQGKVKIENGKAILRGAGVTPKGGGGVNIQPPMDFSAGSDYSPALKVKVGAANKMGLIRLVLRDVDGHSGTFEFTLPAPGSDFVLITPKDGASLAAPNSLDKPGQNLNLKQIMQWQFGGDYSSDGPVDVEVSGILLVAPADAAKAARAERAKQDAAALEKKRQEQDAKRAQYQRGPNSPKVTAVYTVAPDILAIAIQAGKVRPGALTQYTPQPDDKQNALPNKETHLVRGGQEIGWLIGPAHDHLVTFEKLEGDPLLDFVVDDPQTFTVTSADDDAFSNGVRPSAVYRKSKPNDWAQPGGGVAVLHTIYLKLPQPLTPGKNYIINVGDLNINTAEIAFKDDPAHVWSEAVHVQPDRLSPRRPGKTRIPFPLAWHGRRASVRGRPAFQPHRGGDGAKRVFRANYARERRERT